MLALRKTAPAPGLALLDIPAPQPDAGEVLIAVDAVGICGTDLHIADWTPGYESMTAVLPVTIGHEFSGLVADVNNAQGFTAGQRVAVRPSTTCGQCPACLRGEPDTCSYRRGIGVGRDGAFAAFVRVPAPNCVAVPDSIDAELAALSEPLSVSLRAVDLAAIGPGQRVLVLGPGPIGIGAAMFAAAAGAEVLLAGHGDATRLALAKTIADIATVDLGESDLDASAGAPFDAVIEATGVASAVGLGLRHLRKYGRFVVTGIHPRPAPIDLTRLVRMEQSLHGSYRAPIADWPRVLAFVARHAEQVRRLITHRLPLEDVMRGFDLLNRKSACKVIVRP